MIITLKYLSKRGPKVWRYRRKVPQNLRAIVGKIEILIPLGTTESEAIRRYPKADREAETLLKEAARRLASSPSDGSGAEERLTALERYLSIGAQN